MFRLSNVFCLIIAVLRCNAMVEKVLSFDQCDNNLTLVLAVGGVSVVSGIA